MHSRLGTDPLLFGPEPERTLRRRRAQQRLEAMAAQMTEDEMQAHIEERVNEALAQRLQEQELENANRSLRDLTSAAMS